MNPTLRKRLLAAAAGGTVAMAATLIQWHEGVRHKPYKDGGGVLTVCYGHTGQEVVSERDYTEEECRALLDADLSEATGTVEKNVTVKLTESQKAALTSFVYNIGSGAFERSTLLKKLNVGDLSGACDEMRRWKYDEGKVSKGLINRRAIERELCLKPDLLTSPTQ
ncbi:lysozyme [Candidatus Williamhamiltonella defendens]|uniref:lysozyme n=1 Tax=Candidatus Williamhamiltonella defendens TaxID=138072 RepID=UPI001582A4BC|nr:lysozyme [Candidatus Hamiltonella defensa]